MSIDPNQLQMMQQQQQQQQQQPNAAAPLGIQPAPPSAEETAIGILEAINRTIQRQQELDAQVFATAVSTLTTAFSTLHRTLLDEANLQLESKRIDIEETRAMQELLQDDESDS